MQGEGSAILSSKNILGIQSVLENSKVNNQIKIKFEHFWFDFHRKNRLTDLLGVWLSLLGQFVRTFPTQLWVS